MVRKSASAGRAGMESMSRSAADGRFVAAKAQSLATRVRVITPTGALADAQLLAPTPVQSLELARHIREGLPVAALDVLVAGNILSAAEVDRILVPRRTLEHRRASGRLTPEQSDRLVRVARVIALAEDTFGDPARAAEWLRRKTTALGGEAPLDLLDTEVGAREVGVLLGRIAHGIAA